MAAKLKPFADSPIYDALVLDLTLFGGAQVDP
jgi:hypothetical protein